MHPELTEQERKEMHELEDRAVHIYIGFNVSRYAFAKEEDARRFQELRILNGAAPPVFYGAQCSFHVDKGVHAGLPVWEHAEG